MIVLTACDTAEAEFARLEKHWTGRWDADAHRVVAAAGEGR